jgi:BMFP domain-containing protein YqiC
MATDKQNFLQDLQARLAELLRTSPAGDVERNLKAVLGQAFQRLELVTREEFDDYAALLGSLRARVAQLEESVAALERERAAATSGVIDGARDAAQDAGTNSNPTGEKP